MFFCTYNDTIPPHSVIDCDTHFEERLIFYEEDDKVLCRRDDGTITFRGHISKISKLKIVIIECRRLINMVETNAFYDGEEELIPKNIRASILDSLTGGQVSRRIKAFPVQDGDDGKVDDEERATAEGLPPEDEREDAIGPALTVEQKSNIKKIHNNCGHPSKSEFLRCLRLSGAQGRVLKYVRHQFKCSACEAKGHMPQARLPASLPRTFRFNETVGVDLFELTDPWSNKHIFLNMVCWGTLYQLVKKVDNKTAETVGNCLQETWLQYFSSPVTIIADLGSDSLDQSFRTDVTGTVFLFTGAILKHLGKMLALKGTVTW